MRHFNDQSGQGLVEYLILVALMGIATIGLVRILNQNVNAQFANIICGLQGKDNCRKKQLEQVEDRHTRKKDMSDFLNGARGRNQ